LGESNEGGGASSSFCADIVGRAEAVDDTLDDVDEALGLGVENENAGAVGTLDVAGVELVDRSALGVAAEEAAEDAGEALAESVALAWVADLLGEAASTDAEPPPPNSPANDPNPCPSSSPAGWSTIGLALFCLLTFLGSGCTLHCNPSPL
jgi:hypothetical protein